MCDTLQFAKQIVKQNLINFLSCHFERSRKIPSRASLGQNDQNDKRADAIKAGLCIAF